MMDFLNILINTMQQLVGDLLPTILNVREIICNFSEVLNITSVYDLKHTINIEMLIENQCRRLIIKFVFCKSFRNKVLDNFKLFWSRFRKRIINEKQK